MEFLHHLRGGDGGGSTSVNVTNFLLDRNRGVASVTSRTMILLDAIGSMADLLQNATLTITTTCTRASEILISHGLDPKCFELQFLVYRNYNSSRLLESSGWETSPIVLRAFLDRQEVDGGMGPEAIEVALQRCNAEHQLTQVILIGDAPANEPKMIDSYRAKKRSFMPKSTVDPNAYWNDTYGPSTNWREELVKLVEKKVRVHTFPIVGGDLEKECLTNFTDIASHTGGVTTPLDVRSSQSSQVLTDLLTESLLRDAGGNQGGSLVAAYRAKYARTYRA